MSNANSKSRYNRFINEDNGSIKSGALLLGVGALAATVVAGGLKFGLDIFGDKKPAVSEDTIVNAKTLDISPVSFDCRAIGVYAVNGQATLETHGFLHTIVIPEGKVATLACAGNVSVNMQNGEANRDGTFIKKIVEVNQDSMAFNAQFSEADTKVEDRSPALTQTLDGAAEVVDGVIDGACQIVTVGNCDSGVGNPGNYAADMSDEDRELTETYLKIQVLKAVQEQCMKEDWGDIRSVIISSYQEQAVQQGAKPSDVEVKFVDSSGNTTTVTPDFTKSVLDLEYQKGFINRELPEDVMPANADDGSQDDVNINCESEVSFAKENVTIQPSNNNTTTENGPNITNPDRQTGVME